MEKRQKIRGLALGLLCAAFALSGCECSEEEPLALLTLDKERIVFDNPAEGETAQAVLRIEADRRWSVGFIGNGHDSRVSVLSGEAGVHELRIETSETNTGRDLHRLGQLTVALDDGSANRTVDLQQRPQAARQTLLMYFCGTDLYSYYKTIWRTSPRRSRGISCRWAVSWPSRSPPPAKDTSWSTVTTKRRAPANATR